MVEAGEITAKTNTVHGTKNIGILWSGNTTVAWDKIYILPKLVMVTLGRKLFPFMVRSCR